MKTFLSLLMSSFYFFNPSIHQYLRIGNDGAYLSSTPQAIELTETNDNTGRYDDANAVTWVIKPLDACQDTYIIGYRVADANATSFLYIDLSTKTLTTTYAEPGIELKEGHWLIADHDFENQKKRIKREAKLYLSISQQPLYRCFTHKNFVCQRMELVLRTFLYF